ncbi:MAG: DUF4037 domain-containing protein [Planctomycetes bacterium]|nr:DUF4037 domain-containing protein [Planctomycetota bacterium]
MMRITADKHFLDAVVAAFSPIADVKALVLSGSIVTGYGDELSDYDFYVYSDREIESGARQAIAEQFTDRFNIDNHIYETDDEWLLSSGRIVEFIYRSRQWVEDQIDRVWLHGNASVGYTTCFVYNVRNSVVLHDPDGWFAALQATTLSPYPLLLQAAIIRKNMFALDWRYNGSLLSQVVNAEKRGDAVSVNHRIGAFLASYFDILFAANTVLCPGEKHLIRYAVDTCRDLPKGFPDDVEKLVREQKSEYASALVENLTALLRASHLI